MDSGWKFIYSEGPWSILDETEYFPVNYNYKQIAAFKNKDEAYRYVFWKKSLENSGE